MPAEFESGVFTEGKPAWHNLGVTLPNDTLNTQEALQYSGLGGWGLYKAPAMYGNPDDGFHEIPHKWVVTRQKDNTALGVVGDYYRIVPNEEAFSWADFLLGGEGFHYKTAGSLRGGQVVWMLAKAPFEIKLPDSPVDLYILLTNYHDGEGSVRVDATPTRVVCMNTLRAALAGTKASYKIRHTNNASQKLGEAQAVVGLAEGAAARMQAIAETMVEQKISDEAFQDFLAKLAPDADSKAGQTRAENLRDDISAIYCGAGLGQSEIKGTAWGVFNAVVAYNDHFANGRKTAQTIAENRFQRIMLGENITKKAFALLS